MAKDRPDRNDRIILHAFKDDLVNKNIIEELFSNGSGS